MLTPIRSSSRGWPVRIIVVSALGGAALLVGARWAENREAEIPWTALRFARVNTIPGEESVVGVLRLTGPAGRPRLRVLFDNPCGDIPGFDFRVARVGVLDVRATGTLAEEKSQPCPAVYQLEAWSANLPRLSRGVWSLQPARRLWASAGGPVELR